MRVRYSLVIMFLGAVSLLSAVDRSLVPASIREPLLDEIAGETAFRHVEFLAANRDRLPQEYADRFFGDDVSERAFNGVRARASR